MRFLSWGAALQRSALRMSRSLHIPSTYGATLLYTIAVVTSVACVHSCAYRSRVDLHAVPLEYCSVACPYSWSSY
jgi:hypothetical protein